MKFRGGLLYYPPPNAPHITWWMLYGECLKHWGTIFVPEDMTDWAWMQDVARSFQGTWVPLSEQKTDEGNYVWSGPVQGMFSFVCICFGICVGVFTCFLFKFICLGG